MSIVELSADERREALIRISQFVLRPATGEIRKQLQDNVVEMALFVGDEGGSSFEDIVRSMKEKMLVEFPRSMLKAILLRLLARNVVTVDGMYRLTPHERKEIKDRTLGYSHALDDLRSELTSRPKRGAEED